MCVQIAEIERIAYCPPPRLFPTAALDITATQIASTEESYRFLLLL